VISKAASVLGVSDHGGWAILVTAGRDGTLVDRRRVELVDDSLPALPHHHEGQTMSIDQAVALVERVRTSAEYHAALALDAVGAAVPSIASIALRARQPLPPSVAERITDHRARNVADWVMYRDALAAAAASRGWPVHWYDSKTILAAAAQALRIDDFDGYFRQMRSAVGPPWTQDHKLALAAAIVAAA
jgi:hypothetical protein